MREALICEPLRTPVGRFGGMFRDVSVTDLATTVIKALIQRTGLPPERIDDVLLGEGYANGEAPALGRVAALDAGLGVRVPGLQIDRRCGSGLQAVIDASMQVQTGAADLVLAGGAESMSQTELYSTTLRWGARSGGAMLEDRLARGRVTAGGASHPVRGGMLETAENLRREYAIPRQEQDELGLLSHQRAVAAPQRGHAADRPRRAPPARHHTGGPGRAAAGDGALRSRGDGDGGQLKRAERRRRGLHRYARRARRRAGADPVRAAGQLGGGGRAA